MSDVRGAHPIWIVHRIPQPNVEPAMRTLQQELRQIALARSTFFAWAWDRPTLRVPIVSGRAEGTAGKGRVKSLTLDDLMWEFAREAPAGLWAQHAILASQMGVAWSPSQLIIRTALICAVKEFHEGFEAAENLMGVPANAIPTDLETLNRYAPTVIPAVRAHEVLTLSTIMG